MPQIKITQTQLFPKAIFKVTVSGSITTYHQVILTKDYYQKLTFQKITPEELILQSFTFLLIHEPNTSILSQFNLEIIQVYFPEYEEEIKQQLTG